MTSALVVISNIYLIPIIYVLKTYYFVVTQKGHANLNAIIHPYCSMTENATLKIHNVSHMIQIIINAQNVLKDIFSIQTTNASKNKNVGFIPTDQITVKNVLLVFN